MLRNAFNAILKLNSREATLKRILPADTYMSPISLSKSNYQSKIEGPSQTMIHGREFVIPVDSILGQASGLLTFASAPGAGYLTINIDTNTGETLEYDELEDGLEAEIQAIAGYEKTKVIGDYATGLKIIFFGHLNPPVIGFSTNFSTLVTITYPRTPFPDRIIKRGDKIFDANYGSMAVEQIDEMTDLGGTIMGYRVKCE